jgi:hypothetical protein
MPRIILGLIILAAIFAGWAALRQYVERKAIPEHLSGWNRFRKKYLNFTIVLIFFTALCAGSASVLQNLENNKTSQKNAELQARLTNYVFGSNETPAFTASIIQNKVFFAIANPDKEYPIYNVKIKCRETLYPDIGTLYPGVSKIVEVADTAKFKDGPVYFVVWYNNTKSFETDIELVKNSLGQLIATTKYVDDQNKEFSPPWKIRADSLINLGIKSSDHYHPNQHY